VQGLQAFFWEEAEVTERMERFIVNAFHDVHREAQRLKIDMRTAAQVLAIGRVADAHMTRGLYP